VEVVEPLVHGETIQRLWRAAAAGRLPHALLFEGRAGIGKFLAAKWFAQGCLCARGPARPCGQCGPCRRVASGGERGNHADLLVIDPVLEGEERIRIARIAERGASAEEREGELCLETFLGLRPLEGRWRVVLMRASERMNLAAQNALLKTLEEPRPGTLLVLETERVAALLPTIRSRCIRVRFGALSEAQCAAILVQQGLVPAEAQALARLAQGSPGVALGMARNGTRELCERVASVALGERPALEVALELSEHEGEFVGKTPAARERERCRAILDLAVALVRDAWHVQAGVAARTLPQGEAATRLASAREPEWCARAGLELAELRADVEHNLAPFALLERTLLLLEPAAAGVGRAPLGR
jgi:DNA polymerase-3 subunit delta'